MFTGATTFAAPTPAFGTSSSFGATSTAFGSPQQSGTLFGSPNTFGVNKTTTFGSPGNNTFGTQQSTSLFGPQARLGGNTQSLFNTSSTMGSAFGATPLGQAQGSSVPFNAITGSDTMMKNGAAAPINTRHQCITCMKEYEQKSLEELRVEDYQLGRKGSPQQTNIFGSNQAQPTGLFASIAPATNTTPFGQRAPAFGTQQPATGSLFGNINQQKSGFFGSTAPSTAFGTPNTAFSFPTSQPQQQSVFGQPSTTVPTGIGTSAPFIFNQPAQQQPLAMKGYGQIPLTAPGTTAPAFGFGTQQGATSPSKPTSFNSSTTFGQPQNVFGSTPQTSTFFGNQQSKPFTFGQTPVSSSFGAPTSTAPFSFTNIPTSAPNFGGGNSIFGSQTTTTPSTAFAGFGNPSLSVPASNTGFNTFNFGNATLGTPSTGFNFSGNTFGQISPFQQAAAQPAPSISFASTPYKDSPLFYNLLTNRNLENMTKPTNPFAQRAIKEACRRRSSNAFGSVGPSNSLKQMTYPISKMPASSKPNSLFDGFEDEEHEVVVDILSPKTSVKKLSMKTIRDIHRLSLPNESSGSSSGLNFRTSNGSAVALSNDEAEVERYVSCLIANSKDYVSGGGDTLDKGILKPHEPEKSAHNGLSNGYHRSESLRPSPHNEEVPQEQSDDEMSVLQRDGQLVYKPGRTLFLLDDTDEESEESEEASEEIVKVHEVDQHTYTPLTDSEWSEITEEKTHRSSGLICTVTGYYTKPSVRELDLYTDEEGRCFIRGFCVGRENYGEIRFLNAVNVAGLNIDKIVTFRHKEVDVYGSSVKSPPVGEGLNVPAEIHLQRIWPIDPKTRNIITNPQKIQALHYEELLQKACVRMGCTFISFNPETGDWIFRVKHFSKYTCIPEEESTDEKYQPLAALREKDALGARSQGSFHRSFYVDNCKVPIDFKKESEPWECSDIDEEFSLSNDEDVGSMDSNVIDTGKLARIFFQNENSSEQSSKSSTNSNVFHSTAVSIGLEMTRSSMLEFFKASLDNISDSDSTPAVATLQLPSKTPIQPAKLLLKISSFSQAALTGLSPKRIWQYMRRDKVERQPAKTRLNLFKLLRNNSTTTCIPPYGFRGSFGYRSHFFHVLNNVRLLPNETFCGEVGIVRLDCQMRVKDNYVTGYCTTILENQLNAYFKNSTFANDTFRLDAPGIVLEHASTVQSILNDVHPLLPPHHHTSLQEEFLLWKLIEILWPTGQIHIGKRTQTFEMHQRAKLCEWFVENGNILFASFYRADDLTTNGLLLKGKKLDACHRAIEDGNPTLALCIGQRNPGAQRICRVQLQTWEKENTFRFIKPELYQLYSFCAGYPLWSGLGLSLMITSEWLQHFAIFLWYLTPPHLAIDSVLTFFQETIRTTSGEDFSDFSAPNWKYCTPAIPNIYIHLLKMYSCVGYPLDKVFSPKTHTDDGLEYKLSWFMIITFTQLGLIIDAELVESITTNFARQLEMIGLWHWSIFVLKFLPASEPRRIMIRRMLERNLTIDRQLTFTTERYKQRLEFLNSIGISQEDVDNAQLPVVTDSSSPVDIWVEDEGRLEPETLRISDITTRNTLQLFLSYESIN